MSGIVLSIVVCVFILFARTCSATLLSDVEFREDATQYTVGMSVDKQILTFYKAMFLVH